MKEKLFTLFVKAKQKQDVDNSFSRDNQRKSYKNDLKVENTLHSEYCCAQDNNPSEKSANQAETDAVGDVTNTTRTKNNREKQSTQYLTSSATCLRPRGKRENLLI